MKNNSGKILIIIFMVLLCSSNILAQYGSFGTTDAQSVGVANTMAASYGTMSLGKNPAYLINPNDTNSQIMIQLPGVSVRGLISAMSWDNFLTYFNQDSSKDLSDEDRKEFFNSFNSNPGAHINASGTLFAVSWYHSKEIGAFSLSMSQYAGLNSTIPVDLIDLIINGNLRGKTYNYDDLSMKSWYLSSTNLSYSRQIIDFNQNSILKYLYGGISLKMISGYYYMGIEESAGSITTGENNVLSGNAHILAKVAKTPDLGGMFDFEEKGFSKNVGPFMDPAGSGFGIDLGFMTEFNFGLTVGLSLTDIGSINWDQRTGEYLVDGTFNVNDLLNEKQRDSLTESTSDTNYATGAFSTSLPTALRLSFAYDLDDEFEFIPGKLLAAFDYNQGFNDMPGNSTMPRFALGLRWYNGPYIPVISTGFSNDISGSFRWSFGFGWSSSILDINLATGDLLTLMGSGSSPNVSGALNIIFKIPY